MNTIVRNVDGGKRDIGCGNSGGCRKILQIQQVAIAGQGNGHFYRVLDQADVPWPLMHHQIPHSFVRHALEKEFLVGAVEGVGVE